ncbi:uncharacterized protein LOC117787960 [Drosophila innubila]|uniref:uncharacterized protein LOC117787960 n=1 Tax=Drosophila innubila TaxID=198719 RepID=UPI00148D0D6E|nr:uncharacterized protein LOC117787960 [Drosophila innubila]
MTSRQSIHSPRDIGGSKSPTRSVINQSGSPSPQRVKIHKEMNEIEDANIVDSEDDVEYTNRPISVIKGYVPDYTPESAIPPPSPRQEQKKLHPHGPKNSQKQSLKIENKESPNSYIKYIFYAIIIIFPVLAGSQMFMKPKVKTCDFKELRRQLPLQSTDVWEALQINIQLLLNKRIDSPNIYLFLHSSESNGSKIQKLIQDIALETSKCFDGRPPIKMSLKDFETQNGDDYGYPIEQYKNKLKDGNVFLIEKLNDIPPNAARALHTICETHSPIDPDVVIFLTLRTNLLTAGRNAATLADLTLRELWKDVPDHELGALITRVIDQVLLLQA